MTLYYDHLRHRIFTEDRGGSLENFPGLSTERTLLGDLFLLLGLTLQPFDDAMHVKGVLTLSQH